MKTSSSARGALWLGLLLLCGSRQLRAEQFGLFPYRMVNGTAIEITRYPRNATGGVDVPANIDDKPVTSIGEYAFAGCTGLASFTLPTSLTSIEYAAFAGCTSLTSVTLPSDLTSIGNQAFSGCTGLASITLPSSPTSFGLPVVAGCTGLAELYVEQGNPNYASDEGVLLDATRTSIILYPPGKAGGYVLRSSITSIGDAAFWGCTGLTHVTLSSSLTSIGDQAFWHCSGLTSVTLPSSLTSIGNQAFSGCSALTRGVFLGDAPEMEKSMFFSTSRELTI